MQYLIFQYNTCLSTARKTLIFLCFKKYRYLTLSFNRPGWQEVMPLIEAGKVKTLIVKDMSRLGREYLQVGQYTELVFPSYGVRFIAVNNGVDSLYESTNDFTPFRNIMNEFYAKDCSRKLRSVVRVKAESGARIGTREPFGYIKDPEDPKRRIIPDPDNTSLWNTVGKRFPEIIFSAFQQQFPDSSSVYARQGADAFRSVEDHEYDLQIPDELFRHRWVFRDLSKHGASIF